jgi:hypothetical protein
MKSTWILGLAILAVTPLAAQQPGRPDSMGRGMRHERRGGMQHPMMGEMMRPMMRIMAFTPAHLLKRKDALGLTAQQVTRLTTLRDAAKTAHDAAMADAKTHGEALAQTMKANAPDTATVRLHFQGAHAAKGTAHWAMLRAAAQARGVLTDAQRGRVDGWADSKEMRHRRRGGDDKPGGEQHPHN